MKKTDAHKRAREMFERTGQSISDWAAAHGFGRSLVYEVLAGKKACHRGKSHDIAVLLGIKKGVVRTSQQAASVRKGAK